LPGRTPFITITPLFVAAVSGSANRQKQHTTDNAEAHGCASMRALLSYFAAG
jgi:hypothetical protein